MSINIKQPLNKKKLRQTVVYNAAQHPFHLVTPSAYPFILAWSIYALVWVLVIKFNGYAPIHSKCLFCFTTYQCSRLTFSYALINWFWDIVIEATYEGRHTEAVQKNIRLGFMLFIVSEVIFFASFFFSYFYLAIWPSVEIGGVWPPVGIKTIWTWGLPFVNTIILLSSGVTVTWAHKILITPFSTKPVTFEDDSTRLWELGYKYTSEKWHIDEAHFYALQPWKYNARGIIAIALLLTILLGILFTYIQLYEYKHTQFSINSTVFGSLFFVITGFHGLHVIVGTIILIVSLIRHYFYHFTRDRHLGLELAIWYWHFVDVIWIFLFICLYWWGI
jgi:heme/copper-type cytochrome/quinol oxidase subunit 3